MVVLTHPSQYRKCIYEGYVAAYMKTRQRSDIAPVVHRTAPVQAMTQDLRIANAAREVMYLVYQDLQKGSLGNVLYGVGAVSGLHWGTRVNIVHSIALALAYVPNDGLTFWGHEWDTHDTCSESVLDQHVQVQVINISSWSCF